jgi:hypothetical protein
MEMAEEDNTEYFYEPNSDEENGDDADEFNNVYNDTNSSPPRLEPDEVGDQPAIINQFPLEWKYSTSSRMSWKG